MAQRRLLPRLLLGTQVRFPWHLADIIANEFTFNISTVTISGTDQGFYSWDCGTWTKIG